jgi:hypothetical protein
MDYETLYWELRRAQANIRRLETENEKLRAESSDYLDKWVQAQDLAAHRNLMLVLNLEVEVEVEVEIPYD